MQSLVLHVPLLTHNGEVIMLTPAKSVMHIYVLVGDRVGGTFWDAWDASQPLNDRLPKPLPKARVFQPSAQASATELYF